MSISGPRSLRRISGRTAVPMFGLSVLFLFCMAVLVVLWVDVPGLVAPEEASPTSTVTPAPADAPDQSLTGQIERVTLATMLVLWPFFAFEAAFHWLTRPWKDGMRRYQVASLFFCICPPLRMCARSPELGDRLWLPSLGWRKADRHLRRRLEHAFSMPMLFIALMILPVLAVEFWLKDEVARWSWLRLLLHVSTGTIWFAFAGEFILMVSVAERKWQYVKSNWVDLAIVLLPLFSFLRSLRLVRATRLAKLARVQRLTQLARVYRLRGIGMKLLRALILLELFHRLLGTKPERRLEKLRQELSYRQSEIDHLQQEIARMEALVEQRRAEERRLLGEVDASDAASQSI